MAALIGWIVVLSALAFVVALGARWLYRWWHS